MKKEVDVWVNIFKSEINNMNEIGGPETIDDYLEILNQVQAEVDRAIKVAKENVGESK